MNRLERLHALSEHLRRTAPQPVSASDLAARFGVTRRTIERDLASLRNAGVPIYAERGRSGGQVSLDQSGSAVFTLSPAEVSAILVAIAAAGPNMPFRDAAMTAAARLVESLSPTTQVIVDDLRNRIRLPEQHPMPKRARRTIEDALRRQLVVSIDYTDADGGVTTRRVDPVGFFSGSNGGSNGGSNSGSNGWFLIGWCHLREAGRLFRLDRIDGARLTTLQCAHHDVDETLGWVPPEVIPA